MPERLVDVERRGTELLHTFPVTANAAPRRRRHSSRRRWRPRPTQNWSRMRKLDGLNDKMYVSRGGQLTLYGDPHGVLAEIKAGLDQVVRERAYLIWELAGRPDGRADDFWHQAQHQRFNERAYALWEREGRPEGNADEHWFRTRAFEES
jgi:hypothetical protein